MSDIAGSGGGRTAEGESIGTILGGGGTTLGGAAIFGSVVTIRGGLKIIIGI